MPTPTALPTTFWAFGPDAITLTDGCGLRWWLPWDELAVALAGPDAREQPVTVHQLAEGRHAITVGPIDGPVVIAKFGAGSLERFVMANSCQSTRPNVASSWNLGAVPALEADVQCQALFVAIIEGRLGDAERALARVAANATGRRVFVEGMQQGMGRMLQGLAHANGVEVPPLEHEHADREVLH